MKLRTKMLLSFGMIVLLLVSSITLYTTHVARESLHADKAESYAAMTRQLLTAVALVCADMEQDLFDLYYGADLAPALAARTPEVAKRLNVEGILRYMCYNTRRFDSMVAIGLEGEMYFGTSRMEEPAAPMMAAVEAAIPRFGDQFTRWFIGGDGQLYIKKDVYTTAYVSRVGVIAGQVNRAELRSQLGMEGREGMTALLNDQGQLVLETGGLQAAMAGDIQASGLLDRLPEGERYAYEGEEYWLTLGATPQRDWYVMHLVPLWRMQAVSRAVGRASAMVGAVCLGLASVLSALLTHSLTRSLKRLHSAMRHVSAGDFDTDIDVAARDEIGELADRFRWMQGQLKTLTQAMVEKATREQKTAYELLELKYRSLQAQVSPHLLSNILSSINALSVMGKGEQVSAMAIDAGAYLRDNLLHADVKYTTLEGELRFVEEYVALYRRIYGADVRLDMGLSGGAEDCLAPTMLLQPLVENALVHGGHLDGDQPIEIEIHAQRQGERLFLLVRDNGQGMDAQIIEQVRRAREHHDFNRKLRGFGLRSTLQRLYLLYGDNYHFDIVAGEESGAVGTTIRIDLPAEPPVDPGETTPDETT